MLTPPTTFSAPTSPLVSIGHIPFLNPTENLAEECCQIFGFSRQIFDVGEFSTVSPNSQTKKLEIRTEISPLDSPSDNKGKVSNVPYGFDFTFSELFTALPGMVFAFYCQTTVRETVLKKRFIILITFFIR